MYWCSCGVAVGLHFCQFIVICFVHVGVLVRLWGSLLPLGVPLGLSGGPWLSESRKVCMFFTLFGIPVWSMWGYFLVHFDVLEGLWGSSLPLGVPLGLSGCLWLSENSKICILRCLVFLWGRCGVIYWAISGHFLVHFGVLEGLRGSLLPLGVTLGFSGGPWIPESRKVCIFTLFLTLKKGYGGHRPGCGVCKLGGSGLPSKYLRYYYLSIRY